MAHVPETGAMNRFQKSGSNFWLVFHANLEPVSSGTRFSRQSELGYILYSKPESGIHMTEMDISYC